MNPLLIIGAIASPIVNVFKALFGLKEKQAEVVQTGIQGSFDILKQVDSTDAEKFKAAAAIISGESASGGLAAQWRPIMMLTFMALIISFWFGYTPPNMTAEMPPIVARIFDLIQLGIMGYLPARTLEKVVTGINVTSLLKTMMGK